MHCAELSTNDGCHDGFGEGFQAGGMTGSKVFLGVLGLAISLGFSPTSLQAADGQCLVYVGTYTGGKSKGIYAYRMDSRSGSMTSLGLVAESPSPSFLDIDARHHRLFAANELDKFQGKTAGSVTSFSIDTSTGKLTELSVRSSGGGGPCHVLVDPAGRNVFVANYGGGSIAVLPVDRDGKLAEASDFVQDLGKGTDPGRQEGPHAHCVVLDPAARFLFACDLGLDKVFGYRFDAGKGSLKPTEPPFTLIQPASGPRHVSFTPDSRHAYVLNEMSSTLAAFDYDAKSGTMKEIQTVTTMPPDFKGNNSTAEVVVHKSGKFVYASNRGANCLAVFAIDRASGKVKLVEHVPTQGKIPRNFAIDPTGNFLLAANQDSDNVVVFNIDQATGRLKSTGQVLEVPKPVCVSFLPVN